MWRAATETVSNSRICHVAPDLRVQRKTSAGTNGVLLRPVKGGGCGSMKAPSKTVVNSSRAQTKAGSAGSAPGPAREGRLRLSAVCVCGSVLTVTVSDGGSGQSGRRRPPRREENNLDSDYQPSLMQEEGNISIATKTTSQCHVTMVAKLAPYRRPTRAPARWAARPSLVSPLRSLCHSGSHSVWISATFSALLGGEKEHLNGGGLLCLPLTLT